VDGESSLHSQPIAAKVAAETAQFWWAGALNVRNPLFKLGTSSLANKDHESLRQSPAYSQLAASLAQVGKQEPFGILQFTATSQEEPAQILWAGQNPTDGWWRFRLAPALDKPSDGSLTATIAECPEFIMKERGNLAAFLPSADQVRSEPIESAWSLSGRPPEIRGGPDPNKSSNGGAIEVELISNRSNRQASAVEGVDLGVATFIPNLDSAQRRQCRCGSLFIERRQRVGRALLVQWRQHAHGHALKSICEVVDDVPPICNLHSRWSTAPRCTGIHAISISTDDLRSRVFGQPIDQRIRRRILEQVDDLVPAAVDENRAVAAPATKGELVNSEDRWRLNWRIRQCPDQSQQRHAAGRLVLASTQPTARPPAEHQSDCLEVAPQAPRSPSVAVHQQRHLLGKGPPRAGVLSTTKPTHEQLDPDLPIGDGQIGDGAVVTAVERFRPAPARWTKRARRCQAYR
jgi:hypothetical protein